MNTPFAPFTAAMVQMRSGMNAANNISEASRLIREAKAQGADYVLTPEMTNILVNKRADLMERIAPPESDAALAAFRALARELSIHLHIGSLAVRTSPDRAANRSFLIAPDGGILATYDKIHMFDVDLAGGESYRESNSYQPGEAATLIDLPFARLGMTICYDLRFPALFRALAEAGATCLAVPAAFTKQTGQAHWHVLLRARAIENECFVFAAGQAGKHEDGRETFGHSIIIDPWGEVLAEAGTEPGIITARIDPARVDAVRKRIPSLQHGRRFVVRDGHDTIGNAHLHLVKDQP